MQRNSVSATKCRYCDIMLAGREQVIGHMIHSHDFNYEQSVRMWNLMEDLPNTRGPDGYLMIGNRT